MGIFFVFSRHVGVTSLKVISGELYLRDEACRDDNKAIFGMIKKLDIGGFEKAYVLFGVWSVCGKILIYVCQGVLDGLVLIFRYLYLWQEYIGNLLNFRRELILVTQTTFHVII
jgi:hypothetical protein